MRTSLIISLALLIVVIGGGMLEEMETEILSARYVSAAEELRVMAEKSDWGKAHETVTA